MFCTKCGANIDDNAKFCTKCGNSMESDAVNNNYSVPVEPKKSNKTVVVLLSVLIAVVVILAVMLTAFFVVEQSKDIPENVQEKIEKKLETEKNQEKEDVKQYGNTTEAKAVLENYVRMLPDAVNTGNYGYIEPYILDGSALYDMQVALVADNYAKGITERFISCEIEKVVWINSTACNIYTEEEYEISFGGDSKYNDYEWKYTLVERNGQYYLTNLEKWD